MVVAVAIVGVVQVAIDQIVHVVAVRYGRVATIRTMHMIGIVGAAVVA